MAEPRTPLGYDERCEELALHFLADEKDLHTTDVVSLAQKIQATVEDWFETKYGVTHVQPPGDAGA